MCFQKNVCKEKKPPRVKTHLKSHKGTDKHTLQMRWMRGGKWLLIDALQPLFHYLQARLIILTFPSLSAAPSCSHWVETNKNRSLELQMAQRRQYESNVRWGAGE